MKILIVTQYFWPESFKINDLALALADRGHEVTVYTGLPNYPKGSFFPGYSISGGPWAETYGNKINVIRCPMIPRLWAQGRLRSVGLVLNFLGFAIIGSILAPFLVRGRFDKIFMYEVSPIFSALPAVVLRFLKKAPLIVWITDLWPESLRATGIVTNQKALDVVTIFVKFIYRYSDMIYTSSKGFVERIESLGVPAKKIRFWPQWAEDLFTSQSKNISADVQLPSGFVLLFAGNIGTSQDMPTVVAAAEKLKNYPHIHFVILGDGLEKSVTEKKVKELNLGANFHLLGRRPMEDMPAWYAKADALLVSLKKDDLFSVTLPAKLQSYMASKKPIMACLDGEGAQFVDDWNAGLSCPSGDAEALAKAILKFSNLSPTERQTMGDNAFRCYEKNFQREELISILEKDFSELNYH